MEKNVTWPWIVTAIMFVVCIVEHGAEKVHAQPRQPRPRFVQLMLEDHNDHTKENTWVWQIEVWHDEEAGGEFVCVWSNVRMSCFQTGRTWQK